MLVDVYGSSKRCCHVRTTKKYIWFISTGSCVLSYFPNRLSHRRNNLIMKSKILALLPLALFGLSACAGLSGSGGSQLASSASEESTSSSTSATSTSVNQSPIDVNIPAPSLGNNIIGEDTEQGIAVYLPPSYSESEKRYPVLYFLPGFEDSYETYMSSIADSMDSLLSEQKVNEMIIVTINGINKLGGSFYYNSPVTGNWEDFVTKDVVSYVDNHFRTIRSADGRGIAGHSMGGFGVLNIIMHTSGIYSYAYSMSPGVFDESGFSKSPLDFSAIDNITTKYADMDNDAAKADYLKSTEGLSWPLNFSVAYGSTFAGDPDTKAPFIMLPKKDGAGKYVHDDVWKLYEAGYGDISAKLDKYKTNLLALKGFTIEYGTGDDFEWIPEGCKYFSEQLDKRNIPHVLTSFDGDHQSLVNTRIRIAALPFFSKMFGEQ